MTPNRIQAAVPYQAAYAAAGDDLFGRAVRAALDRVVIDGAAAHPWEDLDGRLGVMLDRLKDVRYDLLAVRRAESLPNGLTVELRPCPHVGDDWYVLGGPGAAGRKSVEGPAAHWRHVVAVIRREPAGEQGKRCAVLDGRGDARGDIRLYSPRNEHEFDDLMSFTPGEADVLAAHIEQVLNEP